MQSPHKHGERHAADSLCRRELLVHCYKPLTILLKMLITVAHHLENEGVLIIVKAVDTLYDLLQLRVELYCLVLILSPLLVPAGKQTQVFGIMHAEPDDVGWTVLEQLARLCYRGGISGHLTGSQPYRSKTSLDGHPMSWQVLR